MCHICCLDFCISYQTQQYSLNWIFFSIVETPANIASLVQNIVLASPVSEGCTTPGRTNWLGAGAEIVRPKGVLPKNAVCTVTSPNKPRQTNWLASTKVNAKVVVLVVKAWEIAVPKTDGLDVSEPRQATRSTPRRNGWGENSEKSKRPNARHLDSICIEISSISNLIATRLTNRTVHCLELSLFCSFMFGLSRYSKRDHGKVVK